MKKENMRILQVVGCLSRGGAETMVMNLYREANKNEMQFDFLVYYDSDGSFDEEIISMGGKIIKLENRLNLINFFNQMKRINKEHGPYDVIHVHTMFSSGIVLLISKILKIPVRICHSHSTSDSSNGLLRKCYQKIMRRLIISNSTNLLSCGKEAGNFLFHPKNNFTILPNAINPNNYFDIDNKKIMKCKKELQIKDSEIIIGSIASFREAKNHKFMLDLAKEMLKRNIAFKMFFTGGGSLLNEIKKEVEINGLDKNIFFLGVRDDVPVLLKTFDVLLMPSLYEGLPVTLVESQASGTAAVVSTNITEEIDFGLGLIIPLSLSHNSDSWIDALKKGANRKNTVSKNEITKKLEEHGYVINKSIEQINRIYNYK